MITALGTSSNRHLLKHVFLTYIARLYGHVLMFYLQLVRNMVHGVYVLVLAGVGINRNVFEGTSYVVEFMLKALVWIGVRKVFAWVGVSRSAWDV